MKTFNAISFLVLGLATLFINGCTGSTKAENADERPNIILILTDDLGYSDVGFNGAKDIITPNLDKLAYEGTIFSSAYVVHPFCGPSRAGLLTGRYPHKFGSQYNLPRTGEMSPGPEAGIPVEETYFTNYLQEAGYQTSAIGKWHLGTQKEFHPNSRGFDDYFGFLGGGHNYFPEQFKVAYQRQKEKGVDPIWDYLTPLEHNGEDVEIDEYLTDALSHQAVNFIEQYAQSDDPFFMYLAYNAPHVPLEAKEEDLALFSKIEDEARRNYAAMVYSVDRGVGEIVEALKSTGAYENTLIVFLSDNGGNLEHGATNNPLREGKGSTYEGGYRVPMFFHYPEKIQSGKIYPFPVTALDFYPTFLHLAGITDTQGRQLDGVNIWGPVASLSSPERKDPIYAMRFRVGYTDVGIREGNFKAVRTERKAWELYDVQNDPGETKDLSGANPEMIEKLVSKAKKWNDTHVEPRWFFNEEAQQEWIRDNMPDYEETFQIGISE